MDKGLLRQFEKQAQAYQVKNVAFVIWIQTVWRYDSSSWHNFLEIWFWKNQQKSMHTYPVDKVIIIFILNLCNEYGVLVNEFRSSDCSPPQLLSDYNQQCHNVQSQINPLCCEEAS